MESRYFLSVSVEVDTIGNLFFDPDIMYSVFLAVSSCSSESRLSFVKAFKELWISLVSFISSNICLRVIYI